LSGTTNGGRPPLRDRFKAFLSSPRALPCLVGLGVLLTSPSLGSGLAADDYLHAITLEKLPFVTPQEGPLDLFRFADGDPGTAHRLMDVGEFSWTADPGVRFAFFRPLSALTHLFDYAAWPHTPALMHAQNLLWFALCLAGAGLVYRRLLGTTWVAGLALLFYTIDDTHGPLVGWIANRNALVALAFSLPALWAYDRARRDGWKPGLWLAPLFFALALLGGEAALAVLAYLAAHAVHLDRGTARARAIALAPFVAVVLTWRAVYTHFGFGVSSSGIYFDPGQHPLLYLEHLPRRLPFMLLGEVALPRSDFAMVYEFISPTALGWMEGFAVLVLGLVAVVLVPLWRRDPVTRFFTTGLFLAVLPVCGAFPSDRLLLFVGLGVMGVVAQVVASASSFAERSLAAFFVFVHVVLAPPLLMFRAKFVDYEIPTEVATKTIPSTPDITTKSVILVNPPNDLFDVYVSAVRMVRGEPRPAHLRGLSSGVTAVDVTRLDATTLRLRPDEGFMAHEGERMLRGPLNPLSIGSVVDTPGMQVTVTAMTPDHRPAEALFHFDASLDDPKFVWMVWTREGYGPWTPPPIGETVRLPAHDFRRFILDIEDRLGAK
jgi:hypothetical protein